MTTVGEIMNGQKTMAVYQYAYSVLKDRTKTLTAGVLRRRFGSRVRYSYDDVSDQELRLLVELGVFLPGSTWDIQSVLGCSQQRALKIIERYNAGKYMDRVAEIRLQIHSEQDPYFDFNIL